MINIGIMGAGYVGLVTAACLAQNTYNHITCMDIDKDKINDLKNGKVSIYEKDLENLVSKGCRQNKLSFEYDIPTFIDTFEVIFIAVGTPSNEDGSVNLDYVKSACDLIKQYSTKPKIIVMKSTVPVGTHWSLVGWLGTLNHTIISNPEFLREGTAVHDFNNADRIIVGTKNGMPAQIMSDVYYEQKDKIMFMDNSSAEMVKYASNCLLASKLALWNEIAILCNSVGAKIDEVRRGVGSDKRIGSQFLLAGPGYGGSCFPKDTRGLHHQFIEIARGDPMVYGNLIKAVIESNENHKKAPYLIFKSETLLDTGIKKIAILGLSFKAGTDDTRESPTNTLLELFNKDISDGYEIVVADPVAIKLPKLNYNVVVTNDFVKALSGADVVINMTEWPQYKNLDLDYLKSLMRGNIIIDARNMWDSRECYKRGFRYRSIGNG